MMVLCSGVLKRVVESMTQVQDLWKRHREMLEMAAAGATPDTIAKAVNLPAESIEATISSPIAQDEIRRIRLADV